MSDPCVTCGAKVRPLASTEPPVYRSLTWCPRCGTIEGRGDGMTGKPLVPSSMNSALALIKEVRELIIAVPTPAEDPPS